VHTFPHEIEPSATTVNAGDGVLRVRLRKKSTSNRLL
jgi:HSP20 family molecular chaperone IbpA